MKRSEEKFEETVCGLLEKQCGEYVSREKELIASGVIGSYQLFELICDLEEVFDIRFSQEDIKEVSHFSSVHAIMDTIKRYMV